MSEEETESREITAEHAGDYNCPFCGDYFNRFWADGDQQISVHLKACSERPNDQ